MKYRFDTLQVHGGSAPDPTTGASVTPIYQSASFAFRDSAHALALFNDREQGHVYTRISNPTTSVLEERLTLLEGGSSTVALSSGLSAIFYALSNLAHAGDEIISSNAIYGGTTHLFTSTLDDFGIKVKFVDITDPGSIREAITSRTRALFTETIGNPMNTIADIDMLSGLAHENGFPLVVDNTVTTPFLLRPIEHGADIVVHSLTKYIGGHGLSIGGSVTDAGRFDWENYPWLSEADPKQNNLNFSEKFGADAYSARLRKVLLDETGACLSPFNAFTFLMGLETLSLRMKKHCENALRISHFLGSHPEVSWVNYPGLSDHPGKDTAKRLFDDRYGAVISFGAKGGAEKASRITENVKLITHLANIGDTKSLIIHPWSTTHGQLSEEEKHASGITPDMIRLCVGIEDADDLIEDLENALA